jgi:hypothetical protein
MARTHTDSGTDSAQYIRYLSEMLDGLVSRMILFVVLTTLTFGQIVLASAVLSAEEARELNNIVAGFGMYEIISFLLCLWLLAPFINATYRILMHRLGVRQRLKQKMATSDD